MANPPPLPPNFAPEVQANRKPRIWTALTCAFLGIIAGLVASSIGGFIAMTIGSSGDLSKLNEDPMGLILEVAKEPLGMALVLLPGQLAFLAVALIPAFLSPETIRSRLQIGAGGLPTWAWAILVFGAPAIGLITSLILTTLGFENSESLQFIFDLMTGRTGLALVSIFVLMAVMPGICEEFLFRGYLQSRLLRRWPPFAAISVSSLIFAAAHVDPVHVIAVIPLGFWLGFSAWKVGSIWVAVLGHLLNNGMGVILSQASNPAENLEVTASDYLWFVPAGLVVIAGIYVFVRFPTVKPEPTTAFGEA